MTRLRAGQSTLVYRRDVNSPQHVVVVHRSVEGHWWLVQTQADDVAERVVRFDPVNGKAEEGLGRLILMPADTHGRLLSVGDGGRVTAGDPVAGPALTHALTDPPFTARAGMMSASTSDGRPCRALTADHQAVPDEFIGPPVGGV